MPLDGFNVYSFILQYFGNMSNPAAAGAGLAMMAAGLVMAGYGFSMAPISWSLMTAGFCQGVLAYYTIAGVINSATGLEGGEAAQSSAQQVVPYCVAGVFVGLSLFILRLALRYWASEEATGKTGGAAMGLVGLAGVFIGVQIGRGATAPMTATRGSINISIPGMPSRGGPGTTATQGSWNTEPDGPIRRRGTISTQRR